MFLLRLTCESHTALPSNQGQFQAGSYPVPPYKAHIRFI